MEPGGRRVSANYALATDGTLIEKVPVNRRAFTSASVFDERCLTVETVNTTGGPDWGISDASHKRLGRLAADMLREGLLTGLHYGPGGIIGHRDVPGSYATACPGPSYNAELVLKYARQFYDNDTQENGDTVKLVQRTGGATPEWSLFHPSLNGASKLERGYMLVTDPLVALDLARTWHEGGGSEPQEPRDVYVAMQSSARLTHDAYRRGIPQPAVIAQPATAAREAYAGPTASQIAAEVMRQQKLPGN